ncbi:hypothetical protein PVK06_039043 [Gossypium arboreum]|uniref:Uncharacterized protein n=1 Tax=Gossypium arboreum TaxID=29729 RepID=A0ABR0N1U7_GOSAR|nr:hypothetical protein PVK06_039043 [Gossypium arboreum]
MMVPKGLCDEIDQMVKQFIWGSYNEVKKMTLVSWDSVCQPRVHGGLGLRHSMEHNTSFMMKRTEEIIAKIVGIPPPHPSAGPDRIIWRSSSTGSFSLKRAYDKLWKGVLNLKKPIWHLP